MTKTAFAAALLASAMTMIVPASSQGRPDESKRIQPTTTLRLGHAVERTPQQMDAFDATMRMPSIEQEEPAPRPTMDPALYAELKRQAQMAPTTAKPGASGNSAPAPLAPILNFTGATECDGPGGCWVPPDVAGSIGKAQFVSVSNDVIEIRSRAGALLKINSLNGFMGYSTKSLFDPRVQWDEEYQRWIVTADAFAESSTVQYYFMAFSQTNSATGNWWIYALNTNGFTGTNSFYDYPMVGISQDAILFTANVFNGNSYLGSSLFAVAKARVYNGFGFSVPVHTGLTGTLQPAHQLLTDQNAYAWLAAAPGNSSNVYMYAYFDAANPGNSALYGTYTVSGVAAYSIPPGAAQPASCAPAGALLDSLDNRFQNQGTQDGDFYYQTHTINLSGFPAPRYYIISGLSSFAPTVSAQADYFSSATSYDMNPSIGVDLNNHFALNWTATDPAANLPASMHYADDKLGNPSGATGINVYQGAGCYTGVGTSRWGDYSQTTVDYGSGTRATTTNMFWITNEYLNGPSSWSTRVAKVPF